MRFSRTVFIFLLWIEIMPVGVAQPESPVRWQSAGALIEAHNFPSRTEGQSRLDILYKIPQDFFVFTKNNSSISKEQFIANGEINIEILTMTGESRAHAQIKKRLSIGLVQDIPLSRDSIEGVNSFTLPPGEYSVVFEVDDLQSSKTFSKRIPKVLVRDFSKEALALSDLLFVQSDTAGLPPNPKPFYAGDDVPFGKNFGVYLEVTIKIPADTVRVKYSLRKMNKETNQGAFVAENSSYWIPTSGSTGFRVQPHSDGYSYAIDSSPLPNIHGFWLSFKGDTLEQGVYELEATAFSGTSVTIKKEEFSIRWFEMPSSLWSLDIAIDALEPIATEGEIKLLRTADEQTRRQLFEEFWKKRDTSPKTAFNEIMAEYYRRVDHAFRAFSTVRQSNGVKSDRGKAYILYGPPTKVDRELAPGTVPRELWFYVSLHEQLVFIDDSRVGDYKLASIQKN